MQDRTALVRIIKVFLETLGLLWVHDDEELVITDAGLDLLLVRDDADAQRKPIETQVAKVHPIGRGHEDDKDGQEAWFTARIASLIE